VLRARAPQRADGSVAGEHADVAGGCYITAEVADGPDEAAKALPPVVSWSFLSLIPG
jgi:hypothetical protein